MALVSVNSQELSDLRKNPVIGYGLEGISYQYKKDFVLKLFNYLKQNRLIFFEGVSSADIAFPIDIYEYASSGLLQGVLTKRFNGVNLKNGFQNDLEIQTLLAAYNRGRLELLRFPDINIDDISGTNLLFDYQAGILKFIDTLNWTPASQKLAENLKKFDDRLMLSLASKTLNWHEEAEVSDIRVQKVYERWLNNYDTNDNEIFIEFLTELQGCLEERQEKVKTIVDLTRK